MMPTLYVEFRKDVGYNKAASIAYFFGLKVLESLYLGIAETAAPALVMRASHDYKETEETALELIARPEARIVRRADQQAADAGPHQFYLQAIGMGLTFEQASFQRETLGSQLYSGFSFEEYRSHDEQQTLEGKVASITAGAALARYAISMLHDEPEKASKVLRAIGRPAVAYLSARLRRDNKSRPKVIEVLAEILRENPDKIWMVERRYIEPDARIAAATAMSLVDGLEPEEHLSDALNKIIFSPHQVYGIRSEIEELRRTHSKKAVTG